MSEKLYDALASAIYVSRLTVSGEAVDDDDKQLRASALYPDWTPGCHRLGDLYNTWGENGLGSERGRTWECTQDYDHGACPDVQPGNSAWYAYHRPLHGQSQETARPFVPVQGEMDLYRVREFITLDGRLYRCSGDTSLSPAENSEDWEEVPA